LTLDGPGLSGGEITGMRHVDRAHVITYHGTREEKGGMKCQSEERAGFRCCAW